MDIQIFYFFYHLSSNPYIAKIALFLSYPFTYGVLFLLVVWAMFISKNKMFNTSLLFLVGLFSWILSEVLKNILQASRPFLVEKIVPLYKETGFSFPSDHMSLFTGIAVAMFIIDKRAGYVFSLIAILIGVSRIVIGVHYPVDIMGGVVVGLIVGLIFNEIYKKV